MAGADGKADPYSAQKTWAGRTYTGMKVGRTHTWDYAGTWKERKIGPDTWDVSFRATKARKGRGAPEGSGAPVGTDYHWFFVPTSQIARKVDANTYDTHLTGLKWKLGFRPAASRTYDYEWRKTGATARQRAIRILEQTLADLRAEEKAGEPDLLAPPLDEAAEDVVARVKASKPKAPRRERPKGKPAAQERLPLGGEGEAKA